MTNLQFLITGAFLGLTAGISPGPLLTLVITETLKYGRAGGIKVALSPLVTDLPIILFTLFIISELPGTDAVLGIISLAGCAFVAFLAYESIKTNGLEAHFSEEASQSLKKGIIANFLNPHPYLFWLTVSHGIAQLCNLFLVRYYYTGHRNQLLLI